MFDLFNRKSTAFQQGLEQVNIRLEAFEKKLDRQLASNKADLLEFAELSEKTRRLYLRLTRRAKIEQEATSKESEGVAQNGPTESGEGLSARDVRDKINQQMGI